MILYEHRGKNLLYIDNAERYVAKPTKVCLCITMKHQVEVECVIHIFSISYVWGSLNCMDDADHVTCKSKIKLCTIKATKAFSIYVMPFLWQQ